MADFGSQVEGFSEKVKTLLEKQIRMACLQLFSRIVIRTPVNTGRARANWQAALNGANIEASLNDTDKSGAKTIARISQELEAVNANTRNVKLLNNVAYIQALEYGHSKQASNGMVRLSAAEFPEIIATVFRDRP